MDVLQTGLQANTSQTPGQKRFLELEPKFNVAVTSIFNYDDDFPRQSPVANWPVRVGRLERPPPPQETASGDWEMICKYSIPG